jgi:hypothetical protein
MWLGYIEPSIVISFQLISGKLKLPAIHKLLRINRTKETKRKIYLWKSTNMDELRTEVQTKLKDFMSVSFLTIDNIWTSFKDILLNVVVCFPSFPSSFVLFVDNFTYFSCDPGVSLF